MFAYLSYNGSEPAWATALRESNFPGLSVYSPGLTLDEQLEAIGDDLSARKPNVLAYASAEALALGEPIWHSFCDALPSLLAADSCTITSQMIYRDIYLLVRSDVLIVDARSTNELAVYANLLGIPVVAVSYGPGGLHPWLDHCAKATVNSPESIQEILDVFTPNTPNTEEVKNPHSYGAECRDEAGELLSEDAPEAAPVYEYTCTEEHVFTSDLSTIGGCIVEDCGAEGVETCGSPVRVRLLQPE
jgi:hypothetical protein